MSVSVVGEGEGVTYFALIGYMWLWTTIAAKLAQGGVEVLWRVVSPDQEGHLVAIELQVVYHSCRIAAEGFHGVVPNTCSSPKCMEPSKFLTASL